VRTSHNYTVDKAVADWLESGLPGRTAETVEANRDSLRPVLASIGNVRLTDLTAQDVRTALNAMAGTHATRTVQKAHNSLTRAIRQAEAQDLVRRNVSALIDTPRGQEGRPSQSLTLEQATALLDAASKSRLHAYIALCLLTGIRSEEARALTWEHVDPGGRYGFCLALCPSARRHQDATVPPDAETASGCHRGAQQTPGASGQGTVGSRFAMAGERPGTRHLCRHALRVAQPAPRLPQGDQGG